MERIQQPHGFVRLLFYAGLPPSGSDRVSHE